uniref:Si:ch73-334d15.2 n=1 Tax=Amphilophus citrinellus TaxID=61819 RepID=A0A3Q0RUY1_AMPCI
MCVRNALHYFAESFQDEENKITGQNCDQENLIWYSHGYCGETFHQEMLSIGRDNWCVLEHVIRPYSNLTTCLELVAKVTRCFFPNPDIQDFFIYIHSNFFQNCTNEHVQVLEDAPQGLVIGLTLLSVSFIPILVYLVNLKFKMSTCD